MPAIGIGLVWLAYAAGMYGYILMKGYNVSLKELMASQWPPLPLQKSSDTNTLNPGK